MIPILGIHNNPEYWPNPSKFDPDRFLPEDLKDLKSLIYLPFSSGPRNCIGQKFALVVIKTVLTELLRKWRVKSIKTLETILSCASVMYRPDEEVLIHFMPKK